MKFIYVEEINLGISSYINLLETYFSLLKQPVKMKLWQKDKTSKKEVETFTIGRDPEFDLLLAPFDLSGSMGTCQYVGLHWTF